jgi:hypothetical protein
VRFPNPVEQAVLEQQTTASITRVDQAAKEAWKHDCMEAIKEACRRWEAFTSEDVADILDEQYHTTTHEPRAMGAMMKKAQAAGYCEPTNQFIPSHRTTSNSYSKRVWARRISPNGKWEL